MTTSRSRTVEPVARVDVRSDADVCTAREKGRAIARDLGFSASDLTMIATAISELARNLIWYAGHGEVQLTVERDDSLSGLVVIASDDAPGIPDVTKALRDGVSTSGSFGLGLSGVRRLMDDFQIDSSVDKGTVVTAKKWRRTA